MAKIHICFNGEDYFIDEEVLAYAIASLEAALEKLSKQSEPGATTGLSYTSNRDGTCYVSGLGTCTDTNVVIPSTSPDGYRVTSIGNSAFYNCYGLTSVVIPDSVTSIGDDAFSYCTSLTSVVIPDSVTSIGDDAFDCCTNLSKVYITDLEAWCNISFSTSVSNPMYYGADLYLNDELVTEIEIPDTISTIKSYAFYGCKSLTGVIIPDSVTSIGSSAFDGCSGLTSIEISDNVTSIGEHAFSACTSLTSVVIPDRVTSIGYYAFGYCTGLTEITIPDSVTSIGWSAFSNCTDLTSIEIPDGVTSIDYGTFYYCTGLTSVVIPDSVTSIGHEAFNNCSNLSNITFGGTMAQWDSITKGDTWKLAADNINIWCSDGIICIAHAGGTATCSQKAICELCGEEYGQIAEHTIENGTCTTCGKTLSLDPIVIETKHNPYLNNQNYVVIGTWDFSDARSVNIKIEYQTESLEYDWVAITGGTDYMPGGPSVYDETRTYLKYDGTLVTGYSSDSSAVTFGGDRLRTQTFENVNMLTGSVIFKSDEAENNYYGVKVTVTPNY